MKSGGTIYVQSIVWTLVWILPPFFWLTGWIQMSGRSWRSIPGLYLESPWLAWNWSLQSAHFFSEWAGFMAGLGCESGDFLAYSSTNYMGVQSNIDWFDWNYHRKPMGTNSASMSSPIIINRSFWMFLSISAVWSKTTPPESYRHIQTILILDGQSSKYLPSMS